MIKHIVWLSLIFGISTSCSEEGSRVSSDRGDDDTTRVSEVTTSGTSNSFISNGNGVRPSGSSNGTSTPAFKKDTSGRFDGTYDVTFKRDLGNTQDSPNGFLRTSIDVVNGRATFSIESMVDQNEIEVRGGIAIYESGNVSSDLTLWMNESSIGTVRTSDLKVSGNQITGRYSYSLNQTVVNGEITGVLNTEVATPNEITRKYDGMYRMFFRLGLSDNPHRLECVRINNGQIQQTLDGSISVQGSVQSNGAFLITSTQNSKNAFVSEGIIIISDRLDEDDNVIQVYDVYGSYEVVGASGFVSGGLVDVCDPNDLNTFTATGTGTDTETETDPDAETDQIYLMCEVDIDFSGSGITGFFQGIIDTVGETNRLYCTASGRCDFLDNAVDQFNSKRSCDQECERLASEDQKYEDGCIEHE